MSGIFNLIDRNGTKSIADFIVVSYTCESQTNVSSKAFDQIFKLCKKYTMLSLKEIIGILEFETHVDCLAL